jgi:hypothetical protein
MAFLSVDVIVGHTTSVFILFVNFPTYSAEFLNLCRNIFLNKKLMYLAHILFSCL